MNLFDIVNLKNELQELEQQTNDANFWQNLELSSSVTKQINQLKTKIETYEKISKDLNDIVEMNELVEQEQEETLEDELIKSIKKIENEIDKLEINTLLTGKYEKNNAILTLHSRCRRNRGM